ncbi:MAG: hypothetical protein RLZZ367_1315 [Bacteroidota bacterium]
MDSDDIVRKIKLNREQIVRNNEAAIQAFWLLKNECENIVDEEIKLNITLSEALYLFQAKSDYRKSIDISQEVLERYPGSIYKNVVAMLLRNIGQCYAYLGEYDLAERFLQEAIDNLDKTDAMFNANKALILNSMAMTCEFKGADYEKAINYLNEAMMLLSGDNDAVKRANCLMGLGNLYNTLNNVPKALDKYLQAAEIFEATQELGNIAATYSNIANCYLKMNEFELCESNHNKALDIRMRLGAPYPLGISYFNLGTFYKITGDYEQAYHFLHTALALVKEVNNAPFIAEIIEELDAVDQLAKNRRSK